MPASYYADALYLAPASQPRITLETGDGQAVLDNADFYLPGTLFVSGSTNTITATTGQVIRVGDNGAGADARDPLMKSSALESNVAYFWQSRHNLNYISTPDHASLRITDDIDIRARYRPTSLAVGEVIVNKGNDYNLQIVNNGTLRMVHSGLAYTSTAAVPFAANVTMWFRVTRVRSTGAITFYTSVDGAAWTQLGAVVVGGTAAMGVGASVLEVGAYGTGTAFHCEGAIFNAEVRNGVNGTVVATMNAAVANHKTWMDTAGRTWTVNRSTTIGASMLSWVPADTGWLIFQDGTHYLQTSAAGIVRAANTGFTILTWFVNSTGVGGTSVILGNNTNASGLGYMGVQDDGKPLLDVKGNPSTLQDILTGTAVAVAGDFCVYAARIAVNGTITLSQSINGGALENTVATGDAGDTYFSSGDMQIGCFIGSSGSSQEQVGGVSSWHSSALSDAQLDSVVASLNATYNPII